MGVRHAFQFGQRFNETVQFLVYRVHFLGELLKPSKRPVHCRKLMIDALEGRTLLTVQSDGVGFGRSNPSRYDPVPGDPAGREYPKYRQQNWRFEIC